MLSSIDLVRSLDMNCLQICYLAQSAGEVTSYQEMLFITKRYHNDFRTVILTGVLRYMKTGASGCMLEIAQVS